MKTPICDFVNNYAKSDAARLHMPGHKGVSVLGCESLDITEITGADELFAPDGIIADTLFTTFSRTSDSLGLRTAISATRW